jgi:hypothetical protein
MNSQTRSARLRLQTLEDRTVPSFGFGWAFSFGGPSSPGTQGNDSGTSIVADPQGNVYVAGWLSSENVNFNPNGQPVVLPGGNFELFAAKYLPDQSLAWVTDLGPGVDASLALNGANVYVGYAAGNQSTGGPYIGSAAKLSAADGAIQWTTSLSGTTGTLDDVAVGPSGAVYFAGASSASQAYLAKIDPASGSVQWTKTTSGGSAEALAVAVDGSENVYLTGDYTGSVDFDPSATTHRLTSIANSADTFVWKLSSAGAYVWAGGMGSAGADIARGITVDSAGNAYLTGYWTGTSSTSDFDPGSSVARLTNNGHSNVFIVKLAPSTSGSLKLSWAKDVGGPNSDTVRGIAVDSSGNFYTTGLFQGSADFDPGNGSYLLQTSSSRDYDVFVSELNANGNFVAAARAGSAGFNDGGSSIAVDGTGNVYTTGGFRMTADFDPTASTFNLTAQDYSLMDVFVAKWTQSGSMSALRGATGGSADVGFLGFDGHPIVASSTGRLTEGRVEVTQHSLIVMSTVGDSQIGTANSESPDAKTSGQMLRLDRLAIDDGYDTETLLNYEAFPIGLNFGDR